MKGMVLRFENASIHDGPGLRTVIFLKGCPLNCGWCSTPESQSPAVERGWRAGSCLGCGCCLSACPRQALAFREGRLQADKELCQACNSCAQACPQSAIPIYGQLMEAEAVAERACRDSLLFFHSGGGVTLSGGEALLQADFSGEILRLCQGNGIHTALESCLFASQEQLDQVLPWLDLLYADIKHMDPAAHSRLTGRDNQRILDNLLYIRRAYPQLEVIVRVPVLPGVNDGEEELAAACAFCRDKAGIKRIELLPYHKLGLETYRTLGRDCAYADIPTPTTEAMEGRRQQLRARFPGLEIL